MTSSTQRRRSLSLLQGHGPLSVACLILFSLSLIGLFLPVLTNEGNLGIPIHFGESVNIFFVFTKRVQIIVGALASFSGLLLSLLRLHRFAFIAAILAFGFLTEPAMTVFVFGDWSDVTLHFSVFAMIYLSHVLVFFISLLAWVPYIRDRRKKGRAAHA